MNTIDKTILEMAALIDKNKKCLKNKVEFVVSEDVFKALAAKYHTSKIGFAGIPIKCASPVKMERLK